MFKYIMIKTFFNVHILFDILSTGSHNIIQIKSSLFPTSLTTAIQ